MNDAELLAGYVATWKRAADDFVALIRTIHAEQWDLPTDLDGWSVKDNAAHTAHLEAVLAGAPEETLEVAEAPHLKGLMNYYTEQGVLARRDRDMAALADEIERSVATRYAALLADPPTDADGQPPRTFGGVPWDNRTLLSNRPLDLWMHEQDIRRAIDRPGGYDSPAAAHVIAVLGRALPMVLGKRVAPPAGTTVRVEAGDRSWTARVGEDGRAALVEGDDPDATIALSAEDFVVLAGGRRTPDRTSPVVTGDAALAAAVLSHLAVTP